MRRTQIKCTQSIFTARIRRMREGNIFSLYVSPQGGGVPQPGPGPDGGGAPQPGPDGGIPRSGPGGYPRMG